MTDETTNAADAAERAARLSARIDELEREQDRIEDRLYTLKSKRRMALNEAGRETDAAPRQVVLGHADRMADGREDGVDTDALLSAAEAEGVERRAAEDALEDLKLRGEVYVVNGTVKVT